MASGEPLRRQETARVDVHAPTPRLARRDCCGWPCVAPSRCWCSLRLTDLLERVHILYEGGREARSHHQCRLTFDAILAELFRLCMKVIANLAAKALRTLHVSCVKKKPTTLPLVSAMSTSAWNPTRTTTISSAEEIGRMVNTTPRTASTV